MFDKFNNSDVALSKDTSEFLLEANLDLSYLSFNPLTLDPHHRENYLENSNMNEYLHNAVARHARIQRGGPGVWTPLEFENFT